MFLFAEVPPSLCSQEMFLNPFSKLEYFEVKITLNPFLEINFFRFGAFKNNISWESRTKTREKRVGNPFTWNSRRYKFRNPSVVVPNDLPAFPNSLSIKYLPVSESLAFCTANSPGNLSNKKYALLENTVSSDHRLAAFGSRSRISTLEMKGEGEENV